MSTTRKPRPDAPPSWVCVECGNEKGKHQGKKLWCIPLVLVPEDDEETWRTFR